MLPFADFVVVLVELSEVVVLEVVVEVLEELIEGNHGLPRVGLGRRTDLHPRACQRAPAARRGL